MSENPLNNQPNLRRELDNIPLPSPLERQTAVIIGVNPEHDGSSIDDFNNAVNEARASRADGPPMPAPEAAHPVGGAHLAEEDLFIPEPFDAEELFPLAGAAEATLAAVATAPADHLAGGVTHLEEDNLLATVIERTRTENHPAEPLEQPEQFDIANNISNQQIEEAARGLTGVTAIQGDSARNDTGVDRHSHERGRTR